MRRKSNFAFGTLPPPLRGPPPSTEGGEGCAITLNVGRGLAPAGYQIKLIFTTTQRQTQPTRLQFNKILPTLVEAHCVRPIKQNQNLKQTDDYIFCAPRKILRSYAEGITSLDARVYDLCPASKSNQPCRDRRPRRSKQIIATYQIKRLQFNKIPPTLVGGHSVHPSAPSSSREQRDRRILRGAQTRRGRRLRRPVFVGK